MLKNYRITYYMWPYKDIVFDFAAKSEEEAAIFAKQYRKDPFNIERVPAPWEDPGE